MPRVDSVTTVASADSQEWPVSDPVTTDRRTDSIWFMRRAFAKGLAAGLGTGVLLIAVWAIFAFVVVNQRLDRQDVEAGRQLMAEIELRSPEFQLLATPLVVPSDWTLHTLSGEAVEIGTYRNQTVLLTLWHTECVPCRAQLPALTRLADRVAERDDIAVLMVSPESADRLRARLVGDISQQPFFVTGRIPPSLRPSIWPTAYVLDCKGRIVARQVGAADWDAGEIPRALTARTKELC